MGIIPSTPHLDFLQPGPDPGTGRWRLGGMGGRRYTGFLATILSWKVIVAGAGPLERRTFPELSVISACAAALCLNALPATPERADHYYWPLLQHVLRACWESASTTSGEPDHFDLVCFLSRSVVVSAGPEKRIPHLEIGCNSGGLLSTVDTYPPASHARCGVKYDVISTLVYFPGTGPRHPPLLVPEVLLQWSADLIIHFRLESNISTGLTLWYLRRSSAGRWKSISSLHWRFRCGTFIFGSNNAGVTFYHYLFMVWNASFHHRKIIGRFRPCVRAQHRSDGRSGKFRSQTAGCQGT